MEGSGRCSAAFCESAALRESFCLAQAGGPLSVFASQIHLPRKGEVLLYLPEGAEKLPLRGNLARERLRGRRGSRLRGFFCTPCPKRREIFLSPCVNGGYFASNRACRGRAASDILMVWKKATPRYNKEWRLTLMKKLARLTALLLTGALLLVLTACGAAPLAKEQQAKQ